MERRNISGKSIRPASATATVTPDTATVRPAVAVACGANMNFDRLRFVAERAEQKLALALERLQQRSFDAAVLDLNLPDGDGLDLVREWRASGFTEPVLILSANALPGDVDSAMAAGANGYMVKPVTARVLLDQVGASLQVSQATGARNRSASSA